MAESQELSKQGPDKHNETSPRLRSKRRRGDRNRIRPDCRLHFGRHHHRCAGCRHEADLYLHDGAERTEVTTTFSESAGQKARAPRTPLLKKSNLFSAGAVVCAAGRLMLAVKKIRPARCRDRPDVRLPEGRRDGPCFRRATFSRRALRHLAFSARIPEPECFGQKGPSDGESRQVRACHFDFGQPWPRRSIAEFTRLPLTSCPRNFLVPAGSLREARSIRSRRDRLRQFRRARPQSAGRSPGALPRRTGGGA